VAVVLLGAVLYAARGYFSGSNSPSVNQTAPPPKPSSTQPPAASSALAPAPTVPAPKLSSQGPSAAASPSEQTSTDTEPVASESANYTASPEKTVTPSGKASSTAQVADAPRVIKAGAVPKLKSAPVAAETAAPPSAFGLDTSASAKPMPNLGSSTSTPKPVLQRLNISQGVSVGLLVKKVEPVYPANALHLRVEGAVQLLATISKTGAISEIKVLKGDPQLTRAATDAVKRWKYQPYLLNGEPVEIETQITVNFRLPR
jgi:TonB family protein